MEASSIEAWRCPGEEAAKVAATELRRSLPARFQDAQAIPSPCSNPSRRRCSCRPVRRGSQQLARALFHGHRPLDRRGEEYYQVLRRLHLRALPPHPCALRGCARCSASSSR